MPTKRKSPGMAGEGLAVARERRLKVANESATARFHDAMTIAEQTGLLKGARTELVRGRMPKALVARARARTGVQSDTKLPSPEVLAAALDRLVAGAKLEIITLDDWGNRPSFYDRYRSA